jgi:hypothetical protein
MKIRNQLIDSLLRILKVLEAGVESMKSDTFEKSTVLYYKLNICNV